MKCGSQISKQKPSSSSGAGPLKAKQFVGYHSNPTGVLASYPFDLL